jgi:putative heme-binding domain-containing protein
MVRQLPSNLQQLFALALGESAAGRKQLFQLLEQGTLSLRILQNRAIANRLNAVAAPAEKRKIARLTANLPDASAELREVIKQRLASFRRTDASAKRGRAVFEKNCQNCHQIGGKGAVIGPQLDGIGNRGAARLFEDTIDPNQNVDVAFHSMTIVKTDGKVITGLFRREEGDRWILADNKGKEFQVAADEIEESSRTPLSLMPENVARDLPPAEFFDLMRYLLDQTAKPSAAP